MGEVRGKHLCEGNRRPYEDREADLTRNPGGGHGHALDAWYPTQPPTKLTGTYKGGAPKPMFVGASLAGWRVDVGWNSENEYILDMFGVAS